MRYLDYIKLPELDSNHVVKPFIIAEAGVNHEGSMEIAKQLIEQAANAGADAIKFQTYKAETLASKDSPSYWDRKKEPTASQFELFKKYDSFWKEEYGELKKICDANGIEFMSTPFDTDSALFLNEMMDVFKVSSSDLTNHPFIEYLCDFGKPIILSTGASSLAEIFAAVNVIEKKGNHLSLLHCVLNYPTDDSNANLGMLVDLKSKFPNHLLGYSDHTLPKDMRSLEIATMLGSRVLEKHFTHDKSLPGNDHYHAMDQEDLKNFVTIMDRDLELLGDFSKHALESEKPAITNARRSLIAEIDIEVGTVIEEKHLTWKRPAFGISPQYMDDLIGKKAVVAITKDEILYWNQFN